MGWANSHANPWFQIQIGPLDLNLNSNLVEVENHYACVHHVAYECPKRPPEWFVNIEGSCGQDGASGSEWEVFCRLLGVEWLGIPCGKDVNFTPGTDADLKGCICGAGARISLLTRRFTVKGVMEWIWGGLFGVLEKSAVDWWTICRTGAVLCWVAAGWPVEDETETGKNLGAGCNCCAMFCWVAAGWPVEDEPVPGKSLDAGCNSAAVLCWLAAGWPAEDKTEARGTLGAGCNCIAIFCWLTIGWPGGDETITGEGLAEGCNGNWCRCGVKPGGGTAREL